jgi:hypothetical protein
MNISLNSIPNDFMNLDARKKGKFFASTGSEGPDGE